MRHLLVPALLATGTAHADVDWARGVVTAEGIGLADRHAPSPAAARDPARRRAEEAARAQLAAQLPALPLAQGGTVKDRVTPAVAAALAKLVERAYALGATPHTDGSWNVTLGVPLEAVRLALAAPRALPDPGDAGAPVVIVDGVTAKPALGYAIGPWTGAVVWREDVPRWATGAPRVKATAGRQPGRIELLPGSPSLPAGGPATLFVVITRS